VLKALLLFNFFRAVTVVGTFILTASLAWPSPSLWLPDLYVQYQQDLVRMSTATEIEQANQRDLQTLKDMTFEQHPTRAAFITQSQAQEVLNHLLTHPVVSPSQTSVYDPENRFGLCFGRALHVHLELLRRGVQKEAIKKVFAVGPMKGTSVDWQFHVATAVRGPGRTWWVIEGGLPAPVRVEDWWQAIRALNSDGRLRLYVTEPNRIGPSGWRYNVQPNGLRSYNGYFEDLFRYYKENPLPASAKFSRPVLGQSRQSGGTLSCQTVLTSSGRSR